MAKKASLIIPTKDKNSRLKLLMLSLNQQVNNDYEVIIVMDGCTQDTVDEFKVFLERELAFKPIVVIQPRNVGRAAARNIGIQRASGEIVIFIDDDRIPADNYIQKHIDAHNAHSEDCVIVGARFEVNFTNNEIIEFYERKTIQNDFNVFIKDAIEANPGIHNFFSPKLAQKFRWLYFFTGNVSVSKSLLEKIGGFDENFTGWGWEDVELGYRLVKENVPFYKNNTILNYHLKHEHDIDYVFQSEKHNYRLFQKKMKADLIARCILSIEHLQITIFLSYLKKKANSV